MARKNPAGFHAVFEQLESRDLMTADLTDLYRTTHLNLSATEATVNGLYDAVHSPAPTSSAPLGAMPAPIVKIVGPGPVTPAPVVPPAPTDWFDLNMSDATLRSLARADLARDHGMTRADMLALFTQVEVDGKVSAGELADLRNVVNNTTYYVGLGLNYVRVLASDVVNGNAANATYQGTTLGNLGAGANSSQLVNLVNKWFLGKDHPDVSAGYGLTYQTATGSLFPHTPVYGDIHQGIAGDCYLLSSAGEIALLSPSQITNMFFVNGDGTYTVRFYHNGTPEFVTVDSQLPATKSGLYLYANYGQNIHTAGTALWVAMLEKAYAQMNQSGWLRADVGDTGHNSYDALGGGFMFDALNQVTNQQTSYYAMDQAKFTTLYDSGKMITFGTMTNPADASIVPNHAYAILSYNASTHQVTMFNPWGLNNGSAPGTVTMTWAQLVRDFDDMQFTV